MARRLGDGWKPRVSENLGWSYGATNRTGRMKVYPSLNGYMAFLGDPDAGGLWTGRGKTPELAIREVLHEARNSIKYHLTLYLDLPVESARMISQSLKAIEDKSHAH